MKRHKTLAVRIAELTEDLEELCSEKALLLQKFEYAEDAGAEAFRKDIAIMESGLKRLEAQEHKYAAELDKVLAEYAELKAQAVDLDPVEVHDARQAIRPEKELNAVEQLQRAYGDKYRPLAMLDSKRKASGKGIRVASRICRRTGRTKAETSATAENSVRTHSPQIKEKTNRL